MYSTQFIEQLINGLSIGALYALIAVGYTVVYGIIQLINFAHGEIFMVGAFGSLTAYLVLFDGQTSFWVLFIMIGAAVITAVVTAVLIERFAYRPLRKAGRLAPLITAIGVSIALQEAVRLFYDRIPFLDLPSARQRITFPPIDYVTGPALMVGDVPIPRPTIFIFACLIVCSIGLWAFITYTDTGRAMRAVSSDQDTARLMGINVDRIIVVAFVVGAALAALAGIAHGLQNTNIEFRMGFMAGLKAFTAAVLGGIGNIYGAVVGGLTLGVVEAMASQYIGGTEWKDVWAFGLLILFLVFRPQGILGSKAVDRA